MAYQLARVQAITKIAQATSDINPPVRMVKMDMHKKGVITHKRSCRLSKSKLLVFRLWCSWVQSQNGFGSCHLQNKAMHWPFHSQIKKNMPPNLFNPFTPKSDRSNNSPAASPAILHHTVWRIWLFIACSDERWLHYQFSLCHAYICLWEGWENALFELGSERVKEICMSEMVRKG